MDFVSSFLHIPRTGGKAVYKALGSDPDAWHVGLVNFKNSFAVVRNPYSRAVALAELMTPSNVVTCGTVERSNLSVENFKRWVAEGFGYMEDSYIRRNHYEGTPHEFCFSASMHEFIKEKVEHVLRFETMAQDFEKLCATLGIENRLEWEPVEPDYKRFYDDDDDETFSLVTEKYKEDIEKYQYKF